MYFCAFLSAVQNQMAEIMENKADCLCLWVLLCGFSNGIQQHVVRAIKHDSDSVRISQQQQKHNLAS